MPLIEERRKRLAQWIFVCMRLNGAMSLSEWCSLNDEEREFIYGELNAKEGWSGKWTRFP